MSEGRSRSLISAHSVQIFGDCERLYEFTYIDPRPWPAPVHPDPARAEEAETAGKRFHTLVHMHARGLDPAGLAATDGQLRRWYGRYLASPLSSLTGEIYSEQVLTFPLGNRKLFVRYDRLLKTDDHWLIIDWKTAARAPERGRLAESWQAHFYPFALVEGGAHLNGGKPVRPDNVEMCYYYIEPDIEQRFSYNEDLHRENRQAIEQAIARIASAEASTFPPTGKVSGRCVKPPCRFYSLCHMSAVPVDAWQMADRPAGAELQDQLELLPEFEFEDEPVVL